MTHIKRQKRISSTQGHGHNDIIRSSYCIHSPDDRPRSYDVISMFQDGGHRVGNLLPGPGLVTAPYCNSISVSILTYV